MELEALLFEVVVVEELIDAAEVCVLLVFNGFNDLLLRAPVKVQVELQMIRGQTLP